MDSSISAMVGLVFSMNQSMTQVARMTNSDRATGSPRAPWFAAGTADQLNAGFFEKCSKLLHFAFFG
jgi:hypothetical protein